MRVVRVLAILRLHEQAHCLEFRERGSGIADIEHAIVKLGLRAYLEATTIRLTVLNSERVEREIVVGFSIDHDLSRDGIEMVLDLIETAFDIEDRSCLVCSLAALHSLKRDSSIHAERERFAEVGVVDLADVDGLLLEVGELIEYLERIERKVEAPREIVSLTSGEDAKCGRFSFSICMRPFTTSCTRPSPPSAKIVSKFSPNSCVMMTASSGWVVSITSK